MQSNKFQKIAAKIAKTDKELFDQLIEYERSGKIQTKTRLNFTIGKTTASRFKRYCRQKGYNMSAKIEQAMEYIVSGK